MLKNTLSLIGIIGIVGIGVLLLRSFSANEADLSGIVQPETASPSQVEGISVKTQRAIERTESVQLPVPGSAPQTEVLHSIPLAEIKLGCPRQDCIPSVDDPVFVSPEAVSDVLTPEAVGIALSYKGEERFYPFLMLVTREIVNDVVAGDPLLVTYCPLCGTGIVFDRTVEGEIYEFGVSGMLWQSNLLMYNRATEMSDRNLWSQVLGEAVVGEKTGTSLAVVSSDIMQFGVWRDEHPNGQVLDTGNTTDPYGGDYYRVATHFNPNFEENGLLQPTAYVYGIVVGGVAKAYPLAELPVGETRDTLAEQEIVITKDAAGRVSFATASGEIIEDIEGFWFSWKAAYPETSLYGVDE